MTGRRLTHTEIDELAGSIRATLAALDSGAMTASKAMRYRLEGALTGLEAVAGHPSSLLAPFLPDAPADA